MIATYRLQLHPGFDFADAGQLLPYLSDLGVSHLYLSPITEAREGSTHGYDVVDHNTIREELGGDQGFEELRKAAVEEGLGIVIDFVPNHAGVGPQNATWQELLAYGPHASTASHFDVDWFPLKPELQEKVLLPFLGRNYGDALDDGEIALTYENNQFFASYYDNRFALNPATYPPIIRKLASSISSDGSSSEQYVSKELRGIADALQSIPRSNRQVSERLRMQLIDVMDAMEDEPEIGDLLNPKELHSLLEKQYWRLAYWKTAGSEINYRRFFTINELVALRMEDASVFETTHHLLADLLQREGVHGVRIDHIDGLYDPHDYLTELYNLGAENIWVEKILAPGETLPEEWPVRGATGYGFMNDVMGVLLQHESEAALSRMYRRFVDSQRTFEKETIEAKLEIMQQSLTSERSRLAYELDRISERDYHYRDFTLDSLQEALTHIIACFDRYRTYLPYGGEEVQELIQELVHRARQLPNAEESTVYDFIGAVITGNVMEDLETSRRVWMGRLQQYTAPVAAKGVEDTAFYRYYRLAALNEVGGEPGHFGTSDHAFHSHCQFRSARYPLHLLATSTHDHKRGEDTRMRLLALTEIPERWERAVARFEEIAASHTEDNQPSQRDRYLLYQMTLALLPDADPDLLVDRLKDYMQKAAREAKLDTNWAKPNEEYENALAQVVEGILHDPQLDDLKPVSQTLADLGFCNTISQTLLKLTTPGVPDFYQGSELFDLSLVDPDNRRPVDYDERRKLLADLQRLLDSPATDALCNWLDDRAPELKLYVIAQLLRARREFPRLFTHGSHKKEEIEGPGASHWIAFTRAGNEASMIVAVSRLQGSEGRDQPAALTLPDANHEWREILTGEVLPENQSQVHLHELKFRWAVWLPVS